MHYFSNLFVLLASSSRRQLAWQIPIACIKCWYTPDDGQWTCPKHGEYQINLRNSASRWLSLYEWKRKSAYASETSGTQRNSTRCQHSYPQTLTNVSTSVPKWPKKLSSQTTILHMQNAHEHCKNTLSDPEDKGNRFLMLHGVTHRKTVLSYSPTWMSHISQNKSSDYVSEF
jgi:hypothetical protein